MVSRVPIAHWGVVVRTQEVPCAPANATTDTDGNTTTADQGNAPAVGGHDDGAKDVLVHVCWASREYSQHRWRPATDGGSDYPLAVVHSEDDVAALSVQADPPQRCLFVVQVSSRACLSST